MDEYRILGQIKVNIYNQATGATEEGWQITYTDRPTGVTSRVFVPVNRYPQGVNEAVMSEIADIRLVHKMTGQ